MSLLLDDDDLPPPQPNPYKPDWTLFWVGALLGCCIGYAIAVAIGNGW